MSASTPELFVGIDVSKDWLDIAVRPETVSGWRSAYDEAGIAELTDRLRELRPRLVVLEASGGYESLLVAALGIAGIPVAVVNPRQVRDFARSLGKLAKTDRLDAATIAHFGQVTGISAQPLVTEAAQELRQLVARRHDLIQMKVAEQQRRRQVLPAVQRSIDPVLAVLEQQISEIEEDLRRRLRGSPLWRDREDLLRSVPGVGPALTFSLVAGLPELGTLTRKQIAALVGVAPLARDSGKFRGRRTCWGGRADIRASLYMPTLVATQHNPVLRSFYIRLTDAGKPKKLALTACMRKLLTIVNAILREGRPWNPQCA